MLTLRACSTPRFKSRKLAAIAWRSWISTTIRNLSDTLCVRFGVTFVDNETGEDSTRLALQMTGFLGAHGHGHDHRH